MDGEVIGAKFRSTIRRGRGEPAAGESPGPGRVRRRGAGRKALTEKDPTLLGDLERLVDAESRGDPEVPLRWTAKSLRALAAELRAQGHAISARSVAPLLCRLGYSLQANAKEGVRRSVCEAEATGFMVQSGLRRSRLKRPRRCPHPVGWAILAYNLDTLAIRTA